MAGKPIRLGKAASELNVVIPTLVEFLHSKGIKVDSNPNTRLEAEHFELLLQEFAADQNLKKQSEALASRREKRETISIKNKTQDEKFVEIEDEDSEDVNFEEIKRQVLGFHETPSKKVEENAIRTDSDKNLLKVVDKIDLDTINQRASTEAKKNEKFDEISNSEVFKEPIIHSISNYKVQKAKIEEGKISDKLSIGFSNFKRFENFPILELKAINFFVGPNNAGKSTAVKAYRLVSEYLKNVGEKFDLGGTWKNSANHWLNRDNMEFNIIFGEYQLIVSLFNNERGIEFNDYDQVAQVSKVNLTHLNNGASIEISFLQEHILLKLLSIEQTKNDNDPLVILKEQFDKLNELIENFEKKRNFEYFRLIDERNKLEKKIKSLAQIEGNNNNNGEKFSSFDGVDEPEEFYNFDGNQSEEDIHDESDFERNKFVSIHFDKTAFTTGKIQLEDLLDVVNINIDFEIERLSSIGFDHFLNSSMDSEKMDLEKIEIKVRQLKAIQSDSRLQNFYKDFSKRVRAEEVIYLGANLNKQSPLFLIQDKENQLSQAIHAFSEFREINSRIDGNDIEFKFLIEWFRQFSIISKDSFNEKEIASDFEIVPISGVGYEFNLLRNDDKIPLANMGMGTIQVATLLLRLATLIRKSESENKQKLYLVVVEEPELNLHPNFQSKLCDLFFEVNKDYPNIRFVIETHSEYLIRNSQLIGVNNGLFVNNIQNPFKIVYFDKENGPYEIDYTHEGRLDKNFGEGFYDMGPRLLKDLIKKTR